MNLKAEDQRTAPRVAAQFHAMVSGSVQSEGTGIILDLSRSGCRLESPPLVLPGLSLELRIAVPVDWGSSLVPCIQWIKASVHDPRTETAVYLVHRAENELLQTVAVRFRVSPSRISEI